MMNSIFTFIIIGTLLQEVYSERNDCYIVGEEKNIYTGNKSTTITGRTCQSWSSTVPHSHNYLNNPEAEGNYCRILTDSKPWCFTVDKSVRWEYCGIPECSKPKIIQPKFIEPPDVDCYEEGSLYKGNVSVTFTGLTCQRWNKQTPQKHKHSGNPDADENYCRIINDKRPWCYTTDKDVRWEYCMVPDCESVRILEELRSDLKPPSSRTRDDMTSQNIPMTQLPENLGAITLPTEETTEAPTNTEASTEKPSVTRPPNGNSPKGASTIKDKITTSGPGTMYVTDAEVKTYPATAASRKLTKSLLISIADPVQTENTDLNPKVSIKRDRYVSDINKKISINCVVEPNNQDLAIHWYKDGSMMVNRGLNIRTGSILILKNVQKEDTGLYTCEAGNSRAFSTVLVGGATLDITTPSSERLAEKTETTTESYLTSTEDSTTTAEETETYPTTIIDDVSTTISVIPLQPNVDVDSEPFNLSSPSTTDLPAPSTTQLPPQSTTEFKPSSTTQIPISSTTEFKPISTTQLPISSETDFRPSTSTEFSQQSTTKSDIPIDEAVAIEKEIQTTPETFPVSTTKSTDDDLRIEVITERVQEKILTTTIQPDISTQRPTRAPRIFTTPLARKKYIPPPIPTEKQWISANANREATKNLTNVVSYTVVPSSSIDKKNISNQRKPVHQVVTVPVLITTPRVITNQVSRKNAQRYIYVKHSGKGAELLQNEDDMKMQNRYRYFPESDASYINEVSRQYSGTMDNNGCKSKCDGESNCYLEYNCTHYQHCFERDRGDCTCVLMTCSFGTYWNQAIHVCDSISNVECEQDPCRSMDKYSTYASGFNCRSYYQCNSRGRSMAMCCKNNESFNPDLGKCVRDYTCKIDCTARQFHQAGNRPSYSSFRETQREVQRDLKVNVKVTETYELCYLRPVKNRPTKYFNNVFKIEQDCPPGTVFKADICVCGISLKISREIPIPLFSQVCEENIKIDFSGDRVINTASRPDYIQANDVSVVSSYGLFNGKTSQIFSERFYAVTFRRLEIELLFYSDDTGGPEHQILVSNCDSMARPLGIPELGPSKKPSLAIILSRSTGTLTFLGYSEYSRPAIIRLPYSKNSWNNAKLRYDGSTFEARVKNVDQYGKMIEVKDTKPLTGRLAVSVQPLRIGRCSQFDAFYGYLDFIKMYNNCVPKKT